jgi:hypothetical protein
MWETGRANAEEGFMKGSLIPVAVSIALAEVVILTSPAAAISADLAKKCRDMAIHAHPPPIPPGNKAYAQAERAFFSECISRNGQMPDNGTQQNQSDPNKR